LIDIPNDILHPQSLALTPFKFRVSPRNLSKGGFRIDHSQFPSYSMYKHTTVQKLNCSKKVAVGAWGRTTQTTSPPTGFIPNSYLDIIGNKTYSCWNSAAGNTSRRITGAGAATTVAAAIK
jgi:hypothetical protein